MYEGCGDTIVKVIDFTYTWRLYNLSFCLNGPGKEMISPAFTIPGTKLKWCLKLYPGGKSSDFKEFASLYVHLLNNEGVDVPAKFELTVQEFASSKRYSKQSQLCNFFDVNTHGFDNFMETKVLLQESNALIEKIFIVQCKLKVNVGTVNYSGNIIEKYKKDTECLVSDWGKVRFDDAHYDIQLVVEGESYFVHKSVLTTRSMKFDKIFMESPHLKKFQIDDISPQVVDKVIQFLYTSELQLKSLEEIMEFFEVSKNYEFTCEHLEEFCESRLLAKIDTENAVKLLLFAEKYKFKKMHTEVIKFITVHARKIMENPDHKSVITSNPSLIECILD